MRVTVTQAYKCSLCCSLTGVFTTSWLDICYHTSTNATVRYVSMISSRHFSAFTPPALKRCLIKQVRDNTCVCLCVWGSLFCTSFFFIMMELADTLVVQGPECTILSVVMCFARYCKIQWTKQPKQSETLQRNATFFITWSDSVSKKCRFFLQKWFQSKDSEKWCKLITFNCIKSSSCGLVIIHRT